MYFCFSFLSTGLVGTTGFLYLSSIRNVQTGSRINMLAKRPQLYLGEEYKNKYALPPIFFPLKIAFDCCVLPAVHPCACVSSSIAIATFTGIIRPGRMSIIQAEVNSQLRNYLSLESESYLNKK